VNIGLSKRSLETGKDLILATKPYAVIPRQEFGGVFFRTGFLLALALTGTFFNFNLAAGSFPAF